ncbi:MAG: hypothetical protein WBR18_12220, partial [Anaerolineales bacterium]
MKRLNTRWWTPLLVLALAFSSVGVIAAQAQDPVPACAGDAVAGMVVGVDETTNTVTLQLEDDSLCTVQLSDGTYDHPITSLLGSYFDDINAESLQEALDALTFSFTCTDPTDLETCTADENGDTTWQLVSVEGPDGGPWLVTMSYVDSEGNPQELTFYTSDETEAQ